MGFSTRNRVLIHFAGEPDKKLIKSFFDSIPERIEDVASMQKTIQALRKHFTKYNLIVLDSQGYGTFDLNTLDWSIVEDTPPQVVSLVFESLGCRPSGCFGFVDDWGDIARGNSFCTNTEDEDDTEYAPFKLDEFMDFFPDMSGCWPEEGVISDRFNDYWSEVSAKADELACDMFLRGYAGYWDLDIKTLNQVCDVWCNTFLK